MECSRELILVDLCPESHAYFILCFLVIGPVSRVPQSLSDVTAVLIVYLLSLPTLLSTLCLVETCSCLVPDNVSGTEHSASPVLQRGTVCHPTFAPHQNCLLSEICSKFFCFCIRILQFNHQLNFE